MIIAHNLSAQNAQRMYGLNNNRIVQAMEKLSSGYKINRSADDAAGLAISEKMRAQIRGLNRASLNALDGISVVQTAEGAFGEMQSMLHRINELCTQAANDTNTDVDRKQIQQEIDQLVYEIDETTERTQFNTKKILGGVNKYQADGSIDHDAKGVPGKKTYYTANKNLKGVFDGKEPDGVTGELSIPLSGAREIYGNDIGAFYDGFHGGTADTEEKGWNTKAEFVSFQNYIRPDGTKQNLQAVLGTRAEDPANPIGYYSSKELTDRFLEVEAIAFPGSGVNFVDGIDGVENIIRRDYGEDVRLSSLSEDGRGNKTIELSAWADQNDPFKMMLQVGALPNQGIEIEIEHLNARGLGITGIFVDSYEDACAGMKKAQDAIDKVSTARASLGAQQNRLEHTIKNLDNIAENTQAAESRIRDTDMAKMMVEYTRNKILAQVGEAMIANAKSLPEAALQLLR